MFDIPPILIYVKCFVNFKWTNRDEVTNVVGQEIPLQFYSHEPRMDEVSISIPSGDVMVEAGLIEDSLPRYSEEVEAHGGLLGPPEYVRIAGEPPPCYDE